MWHCAEYCALRGTPQSEKDEACHLFAAGCSASAITAANPQRPLLGAP
jgi:hypothetical protein